LLPAPEQPNNKLESRDPVQPETEPRVILVHRCNLAHQNSPTDYRCQCKERITRTEADALLDSGQAEWLATTRAGKPYVRHRSIIVWQSREELENLAAEQTAARETEVDRRKAERKEAEKRRDIGKVIKAFRDELNLSPDDEHWTDEEIIRAFKHVSDSPEYLNGVGMKTRLLDAPTEDVLKSSYQEMLYAGRLSAVLLECAVKYWNVFLKYENQSMNRGRFITEADKGCGELVSGGYDEPKLADVAAAHQRSESTYDENGKRDPEGVGYGG
jgi:hypothetical protein